MQIARAPSAHHGVDTLMYVGDDGADYAAIDLGSIIVGSFAVQQGISQSNDLSPLMRVLLVVGGATVACRGVRYSSKRVKINV